MKSKTIFSAILSTKALLIFDLQRGGDIKYANLLVSPGVFKSPPSGITVRGSHFLSSQQLQQQQNLGPTAPDENVDGHTDDKMDTSPLVKTVITSQPMRSKIPGAPSVHVMSPSKVRTSLCDRTNYD
jgi:hypothetical protein